MIRVTDPGGLDRHAEPGRGREPLDRERWRAAVAGRREACERACDDLRMTEITSGASFLVNAIGAGTLRWCERRLARSGEHG